MEKEATTSMNKAAELEHSIQSFDRSDIIECKAMFDGTWHKRGHSSLQGAVTAIAVETGIKTLKKVCKACSIWASKPDGLEKETWRANHKCPKNYVGSTPAIEQEGVKKSLVSSHLCRKTKQ